MMTTLVTDHIPLLLFVWVLANQGGVPLPVVPALLTAGALARGTGDLAAILAVVVGAALCADLAWYSLGRWRGRRALTWFGRFRWARRAMDRITNLSPIRRAMVLVGVRFLPEASPVTAGLAGASRATLQRYLPYAIGTAAVWAGTWTGMGYVLGSVITRGDSMILGAVIVLAVGGVSVVLGGVLAVSGHQAREEEELAARTASSSHRAA